MWWLAETTGAVQEARRLDAVEVGTEHLLLAAYAEPRIRQILAQLGADLSHIQDRVGRPRRPDRIRLHPDPTPAGPTPAGPTPAGSTPVSPAPGPASPTGPASTAGPALSAEAQQFLDDLAADIHAEHGIGPHLLGEHPGHDGEQPDPATRSWLLRRLLARLLTRPPTHGHPNRAQTLIEDLDLAGGAVDVAEKVRALDADTPVPQAPTPDETPPHPGTEPPPTPGRNRT